MAGWKRQTWMLIGCMVCVQLPPIRRDNMGLAWLSFNHTGLQDDLDITVLPSRRHLQRIIFAVSTRDEVSGSLRSAASQTCCHNNVLIGSGSLKQLIKL